MTLPIPCCLLDGASISGLATNAGAGGAPKLARNTDCRFGCLCRNSFGFGAELPVCQANLTAFPTLPAAFKQFLRIVSHSPEKRKTRIRQVEALTYRAVGNSVEFGRVTGAFRCFCIGLSRGNPRPRGSRACFIPLARRRARVPGRPRRRECNRDKGTPGCACDRRTAPECRSKPDARRGCSPPGS